MNRLTHASYSGAKLYLRAGTQYIATPVEIEIDGVRNTLIPVVCGSRVDDALMKSMQHIERKDK